MRPAAHSSKWFKSAPLVRHKSVADGQVQRREAWTEGVGGKIQPKHNSRIDPYAGGEDGEDAIEKLLGCME